MTPYVLIPAAAMIVTALLIADERRLPRAIRLYAIQSLLLATVFAMIGLSEAQHYLLAWACSAIITKTILVPLILDRLVKRTLVYETKPLIGGVGTWLLSALGVAAGFYLASRLLSGIEALLLGVSISLFLIGLVQMTARRSLVKQLLGFCHFENGSHLTLAILAPGLPETVEIGIATDAVLLIFVGALVAYRIWTELRTLDYTSLTLLKEEVTG